MYFALFATYSACILAVYSTEVHETSDGSGVVSQITAIYARTKRQQRRRCRQRQRWHRWRPRRDPASACLARPEPIKAKSHKHVVNWPHFTAASRRISSSISPFN